MSLWNSTDANTGAPKFAIFAGLGVAANGNVLFGNTQVSAFHANVGLGVDGLTPAEKANTPGPAHAGWVSKKIGTGYVSSIAVTGDGGTGYTPGPGFITFAGGGAGSGANATYVVNANGNVANVTVNSTGANYNVAPTANANAAYTTNATFVITMGGRTGRIEYETLVAGGNIA